MRINLPNQITIARFFLALVFLVLLGRYDHRLDARSFWMLDAAVLVFIVAAVSDAVDGYLARKQNQITSFGRIVDPFADKLLVVGGFILLLGRGFVDEGGHNLAGLSAWMVVLIVGRELLVSGLRGFSEAGGKPYASNMWGKLKMVVQSVTLGLILISLGRWRNVELILTVRDVMIWLTIGVTSLSVVGYLIASREALSEQSRG